MALFRGRAYAPVVELDTIKASDAFGSGSSPDGCTRQKRRTHAMRPPPLYLHKKYFEN